MAQAAVHVGTRDARAITSHAQKWFIKMCLQVRERAPRLTHTHRSVPWGVDRRTGWAPASPLRAPVRRLCALYSFTHYRRTCHQTLVVLAWSVPCALRLTEASVMMATGRCRASTVRGSAAPVCVTCAVVSGGGCHFLCLGSPA
jgi:hypothetical protein